MKRTDLEALGLEKVVVDKVIELHGADIEEKKAEIEKLNGVIKEKEDTITKLGDDLKAGEGDAETIKKLQQQVDDYKEAEKQRKEDEQKAAADKVLTDNILEAFGDKQFVNDFTKNSIMNQIKADLQKEENKGKGVKDIFESITKDAENIFKNPQHEELNIPGTNGGKQPSSEEDARIREIMGLSAKND